MAVYDGYYFLIPYTSQKEQTILILDKTLPAWYGKWTLSINVFMKSSVPFYYENTLGIQTYHLGSQQGNVQRRISKNIFFGTVQDKEMKTLFHGTFTPRFYKWYGKENNRWVIMNQTAENIKWTNVLFWNFVKYFQIVNGFNIVWSQEFKYDNVLSRDDVCTRHLSCSENLLDDNWGIFSAFLKFVREEISIFFDSEKERFRVEIERLLKELQDNRVIIFEGSKESQGDLQGELEGCERMSNI